MARRPRFSLWLCTGLAACLLLAAGCDKRTPTATATGTAAPAGTRTVVPAATLEALATPTILVAATLTQPAPQTTATSGAQATTTPSVALLRIGWTDAVDQLDPLAPAPGDSDVILSLLYDRLIYPGLDNTYQPALAQSWTSVDGGRTWLLKLQEGVQAHDGQPLTAEDVAFALGLYASHPMLAYYGGYTATIESAVATSSDAVRVVMSEAVQNIEAYLCWQPIVPKRIWESAEASGSVGTIPALLLGSGPFRLQEYWPGARTVLTANRQYWMGSPQVDTVVFQTYPNDDSLGIALRDGEVDLVAQVPTHWIAYLRRDPRIEVISGPRIQERVLLFNQSAAQGSKGHPVLQDPQLRLAIAHAIDKGQLIDIAVLGYGTPGLGILPPAMGGWFHSGIEHIDFDLDAAQQLLQSAGYHDTDNDGWREMPGGGKPVELRLFIPSDSASGPREAEMLSNWLRQVGLKCTPQTLTPAALQTALADKDYDLALIELTGPPDPGFLLGAFTTAQLGSGRNVTGYSSGAYDRLYAEQAAVVDPSVRRSLVWQMQEILYEDRPCIALYYKSAVQAYRRDRFGNWLLPPGGRLDLTDARSLVQVEPLP
jgi:peptide/nickel transport system substrate-binding protein